LCTPYAYNILAQRTFSLKATLKQTSRPKDPLYALSSTGLAPKRHATRVIGNLIGKGERRRTLDDWVSASVSIEASSYFN
jgi:hypothetical protein